jgi:hypothetical protein
MCASNPVRVYKCRQPCQCPLSGMCYQHHGCTVRHKIFRIRIGIRPMSGIRVRRDRNIFKPDLKDQKISDFGQKAPRTLFFDLPCHRRLSVAGCDRSELIRKIGEPCIRPKSALDAAIEVHLEYDDSVECNTQNMQRACKHCNHSAICTQIRQMLHLLGPPGQGIKACDGITEQELVSDWFLRCNYLRKKHHGCDTGRVGYLS